MYSNHATKDLVYQWQLLNYLYHTVGKPGGYDRVRNAEIGNKVC